MNCRFNHEGREGARRADQQKLAQIGADGVHVDKMFPCALDYNPNLPMSPDTAPWEGAILLTKEVMAACRNALADFKVPREIHFVDEMPRSTLEKVAKAELRKMLG